MCEVVYILHSSKVYKLTWIVGNEKDEDGFYFKGDTSVPSYYHSEKLEDPSSENWDGKVEYLCKNNVDFEY